MTQGKWYLQIGFFLPPTNIPNWTKLSQKFGAPKIRNLNEQHWTTATKFELARIHLQNLCSIVPTGKITDLTPFARNPDNSITVAAPNLKKFLPFLTEYEAFLFSLISAIDSFLLEVNLICHYQIPAKEVSKKTLRARVEKCSQENEFANYLRRFLDSDWLKYLGDLRNLAAHHVVPFPVSAPDLKLYLPVEPKLIKTGTFVEHLDFFVKLNELLSRAGQEMNFGYGHLITVLNCS